MLLSAGQVPQSVSAQQAPPRTHHARKQLRLHVPRRTCIIQGEVLPMILILLVVIILLCWAGPFALPTPNPHIQYGGGAIGLILFILLILLVLKLIPGL